MDFSGPASATRDRAFHLDWRRTCHASLELAAADAVRMAANYLLASYRAAGSLPDSVRRLEWRRSSLQIRAANGRALGADDARGAREVPTEYALTWRRPWGASQRNQGAMNPSRQRPKQRGYPGLIGNHLRGRQNIWAQLQRATTLPLVHGIH